MAWHAADIRKIPGTVCREQSIENFHSDLLINTYQRLCRFYSPFRDPVRIRTRHNPAILDAQDNMNVGCRSN